LAGHNVYDAKSKAAAAAARTVCSAAAAAAPNANGHLEHILRHDF
jgi:hypothetical protein